MRVLIIGYGSIGHRHEEVLSSFSNIDSIDIVTKQMIETKTTFRSLQSVKELECYDYFIIASETNKHYEQLAYLEERVKNKLIFCEKPIFEKKRALKIVNNSVFVGYVLRFHPLLQKLKSFLIDESVISVNVNCGQYLPTWREGDYRDSYSAKKDEGGGVLLDLSHEIDYAQWLFGDITELKSYRVKVSDLEIDSDDLSTFIARLTNNAILNVSIDYISKITYRKMLVHTLSATYELDFIANKLVKKDKNQLEEIFSCENLERNSLFQKMHESILGDKKNMCTYEEGLKVMDTISIIEGQNNG